MHDYHWERPLEKESPEVLSHMEAWKTMGKVLKAKGGTHAPKMVVFTRGGFGQ